METSIQKIQAIDHYHYLGGGYFEPRISLEDYLLKLLQEEGSMTRGEMSSTTGIPRTTLYDTLVKLLMQNKVEKFSLSNKKRGRPKTYYRLA